MMSSKDTDTTTPSFVMSPAGPMLCSSQASGSPFRNKLTFQVTWLQMTRHPLHLYVGVAA